jgi:hypothetical protein
MILLCENRLEKNTPSKIDITRALIALLVRALLLVANRSPTWSLLFGPRLERPVPLLHGWFWNARVGGWENGIFLRLFLMLHWSWVLLVGSRGVTRNVWAVAGEGVCGRQASPGYSRRRSRRNDGGRCCARHTG